MDTNEYVVDIKRCDLARLVVGVNDLLTVNPELAAQWHPIKNGAITPNSVAAGSNKKAWWKCSLSHEWEATVASRTRGTRCPYCAGKRPIVGVTDLATANQELAAQWHPTKNGKILPQDFTPRSHKKVWWICPQLHEWETSIDSRAQGNGCPICDSKRVQIGFNDLSTMNPKLASEWHPTKNEGITPEAVTPGSNRKVWWICGLSHEWETAIKNRSKGHGCPYCSGNLVLVGYNDLKTLNPELAAQWHPVLNQKLTPYDVTVSSQRKVWWICELFHVWESKVSSRSLGNGCPYCSGHAVLGGFNDLVTINPKLAAEWHPTKNGETTSKDITAGSRKSVWWVCSLFHEWEALVINRSKGNGCPYCSGNRVLAGFNDLKTIKPELISQWHPSKNGEFIPDQVTVSSNRKVWWLCSLLHEWESAVSHRSNGRGCPTCVGKRVQIGFNDLRTLNPNIAAQWHPTKNGMLTPSNVTVSSGKKVWWICSMSHEWETTVNARSDGNGCPKCSAGITERTFRAAFEKFSGFSFAPDRIHLIRFSRKLDRAKIDMLNDDLKLVIEYDGEWTHGANGPEGKTLEQKLAEDKETTQALVDSGYKVIRIREHAKIRKLPFIPLDAEYETNVFQITYRSYGKNKNDIHGLTHSIIEGQVDWFKMNDKVLV